MATMAVSKVERAHQMYRDGRYNEALGFYSDALAIAKTKAQKIALHSNRAACFLKLHDFKKAADECTSVLELDHTHTGALMLRAQTLVTLKEYQSALFDVNRLLEGNPSSEVYLNLQGRLKSQLSLAPIPEVESELEETDEETFDEMPETDEELEEARDGQQIEDSRVAGSVEKDDYRVAGSVEKDDYRVVASVEKEENPVAGSIERTEPKGQASTQSNGNLQSSDPRSKGWQAIPMPKGHSRLDYSRWDAVADGSSEDDDDDDDDEEIQPQYRFRVKTVDLRPVK